MTSIVIAMIVLSVRARGPRLLVGAWKHGPKLANRMSRAASINGDAEPPARRSS